VWAVMGAAFAYGPAVSFFLFWIPTYMMRARGFSESELQLLALLFVLAGTANLVGGIARDKAVERWGPKWGHRAIGIIGVGAAMLCALAALVTANRYVALGWLGVCYAGITFQQPTVWAVCSEIGKRYSGAVAGAMNTAFSLGSFVASLMFGFLVARTGSYDSVLTSMTATLLIAACLWFCIDATETLGARRTRTV
jgi:MFS transporter, ACS family, glucarate transporter